MERRRLHIFVFEFLGVLIGTYIFIYISVTCRNKIFSYNVSLQEKRIVTRIITAICMIVYLYLKLTRN